MKLKLFLLTALLAAFCFSDWRRPAEATSEKLAAEATSPARKADVDPGGSSRIFEGTSAYIDGMHGKGRKGARKLLSPGMDQRRPFKPVLGPDPEPLRMLRAEEQVAAARLERQEWDLAVPSLERAIKVASSAGSPEDGARLEMLLKTARDRAAQAPALPREETGEVNGSAGMRLVIIPAGTFVMGNDSAQVRRIQTDWNIPESLIQPEQPAHKVRISKPFLMGKYDVTVGQFKQFVSETGYRTVAERQGWGWVYDGERKRWEKTSGASWRNPGGELWDDHPVTLVCFADAEAFCEWLGKKDGRRYYLPTEAQWEYAARGAREGQRFPWGNDYPDGRKLNMADRRSPVPWADRTVDDQFARTSPAGSYEPNAYWLYDMAGNVWQLCSDYYDAKTYEGRTSGETADPTGPGKKAKRVVRGGNWAFEACIARNSFRFGIDPDLCVDICGFRVAADLGPNEILRDQESQAGATASPATTEQVTEVLAKVKTLVATGQRAKARKVVDRISRQEPGRRGTSDASKIAVRDVLNALIDVTEDKSIQSFSNSLGMKMVRIPAGSFLMGSSETDISWALTTLVQPGQQASLENEYPFHKVRISQPYFISATEVTVGQFKTFVEETGYITDAEEEGGGQIFNTKDNRFELKRGSSWRNPGWTITDDQPVVVVSWNDAQAFVEWLTAKERLSYKLPTEAQWEYAARGGLAVAQFPWGDALPDGRRANYADKNADFEWRDRTADDGYKYVAPVASFEANAYGLYDMAGNVLEWVRDYYGEDYYRFSPEVDPEGPGQGENRVTKGGEWTFGPVNLRCGFRGWSRADMAYYNTGFRVVVDTGSPARALHFANDFLTKEWVPGQDQREVAMAVAKEKERQAKSAHSELHRTPKAAPQPPAEPPMIRGILIVDFLAKSSAKKAGLTKGDVIIQYHGHTDLTTEEFLALTARSKREKAKPTIVFVRDGRQYSVRVAGGPLGISVVDTSVRQPAPKAEPSPEKAPDEDGKKKPKDWT